MNQHSSLARSAVALLVTFVAGCAATTAGFPEPHDSSDSTTLTSDASSSSSASTAELPAGELAPNFVSLGHDGLPVALSELRGRTVVLFFYTRDDTPTDTRQISELRDAYASLKQKGAVVVGVSTDSPETHRAFAKQLRLPFPLLSDPNGSLARAYGVPVTYGVFERRTFVIGSDGTVEKVQHDVVVPAL